MLIGADPEFFLMAKQGYSHKMALPPSWLEKEPFEVDGVGRVVADGVAAEVHVVPSRSLKTVKSRVLKVMKEFTKETGLEFSKSQVMYVVGGFNGLETWPDCRPSVFEIGCDPFYLQCRSSSSRNIVLEDPELEYGRHYVSHGRYLPHYIISELTSYERRIGAWANREGAEDEARGVTLYAGGHVHLELPEFVMRNGIASSILNSAFPSLSRLATEASLVFAGVGGRIISTNKISDVPVSVYSGSTFFLRNTSTYSYRRKPYGLEIRNPSNLWLWDSAYYRRVNNMINRIHRACTRVAILLSNA